MLERMSRPTRWQARVRAVPVWIRIVLVVPPLLLTAYWAFTYSGLYRWIAELEIGISGSYTPFLTMALCALASLSVSLVAVALIAFSRGDEADRDASSLDRAPPFDLDAWLREHRLLLIGMIMAPMFLAVAGYFLVQGATAGALSRISATALEAGEAPASRYVDLEGRLASSHAAAIEETHQGSKSTTLYVPIVSPGWTPDEPVAAFLAIDGVSLELDAHELAGGQYRGVLAKNDLPGLARTDLEGRLTTASPYWVLEHGKSPDDALMLGTVFGTIGSLAGLLVLLRFMWLRRSRLDGTAAPQ
jgi:hypothetical protein